jgi:hypothetical protein
MDAGTVVNLTHSNNHTLVTLCSNCGTLLTPTPKPCYWIFQFNPKKYPWFDRIKETRNPELWLESQHPEYMKKGDFVAIWASGKNAGVYALSVQLPLQQTCL